MRLPAARLRAALWAALLCAAAPAHGAPPAASALPRCASAAARLPEQESAAEFWVLSARFGSGHHLFLELTITNVGLGDRNAAVLGHLVEPDGTTRAFRKAKRVGEWSLSGDGLRMEVGAVTLDQRCPVARLDIERDDMAVHVAFRPAGTSSAPQLVAGGARGFERVRAAGPAEGTLWVQGMERPLPVEGRVALTHRWVDTLESRLVLRRIEFFSLGGDVDLYLSEAKSPAGDRARWLVVEEGGRPLRETETFEVKPDWGGVDANGFALPRRLQLQGAGLSGHLEMSKPLVRYDPLRDLPAPLRLALAVAMRWRTAWSPSPFELRIEDESGAERRVAGVGLVQVTSFNPDPPHDVASPPPTE